MKLREEDRQIQEFLKSGKIVSGGFLGTDNRHFFEIIEEDKAGISSLGFECESIAKRMREISEKAQEGLGNWVAISDKIEAKVDEAKGDMICPWPHKTKLFHKRVTTVRRKASDEEIKWSDLSIHFVAEHCFFQGRGSLFRLEPARLVKIIF
ncbi:MAG TPA: hypothetical protein PK821_06800 [Victivallales bacterium]|nr:hypothetical protein [Victivallales bacterium]